MTPAADPTKPEAQLQAPAPAPVRWDSVKADPAWHDPTSAGALNTDQKLNFLDAELAKRVEDAHTLNGSDYTLAMGMLDEWYQRERLDLERTRAKHDALWLRGKPGAIDELWAAGTRLAAESARWAGSIETGAQNLARPVWSKLEDYGIRLTPEAKAAQAQAEAEAKEWTVEIPDAILQGLDPRLAERSSTAAKVWDTSVGAAPQLFAAIVVSKGAGALAGARAALVAPFLFGAAAEAGPTYHEAMAQLTNQGIPLDQAEAQAVRAWLEHGTVSGALEAITPVLFLNHLDKATGGQLKKKLIAKVAGTGLELTRETLSEGVTEFLQEEWGQNVARRFFIDPNLSDQEREALLTQWKVSREVATESGSFTGFLLSAVATAAGIKGRAHVTKDQAGKMRAKLDQVLAAENRADLAAVAAKGPPITESFITEDPRYQQAPDELAAATAAQVIAYEREFAGRPGFEIAFQIHKGERTLDQDVADGVLTEAEAFSVITNSEGIQDPTVTPADVRVFGRNSGEFSGKVYRAAVDIYAGATPQDVAQEVAEAWFKAGLQSGTIDPKGYHSLKKAWEAQTGQQSQDDTPRGLVEWFSARAVEFATLRARQGETPNQVGQNLAAWLDGFAAKPEARTAAEMGTALNRMRVFVAQSIRNARRILRAVTGTGDEKFLADLEAATGFSSTQLRPTDAANAPAAEVGPPVRQLGPLSDRRARRAQAEIDQAANRTPPAPTPEDEELQTLHDTVRRMTDTQRQQLADLVDMNDQNRHDYLKQNKVADNVLTALDLLNPGDSFVESALLRRAQEEDLRAFREAEGARSYTLDEGIKIIGGLLTPGKAKENGESLWGEFRRIQRESGREIIGRFRKDGQPYDLAVASLNELGFEFETPSDLAVALEAHDRGQTVMSKTPETAVERASYSTGDRTKTPAESVADYLRTLKQSADTPPAVAAAQNVVQTYSTRSRKAGLDEYLSAIAGNQSARISDRSRRQLARLASRLDKTQVLDKATRLALRDDIRTLEQIIREMPREIRHRLGGFSTLASKATPKVRAKYLMQRLNRAVMLTEEHSRQLHLENIASLFEAARTIIPGTEPLNVEGTRLRGTGDGNRREKGRFTPETQRIIGIGQVWSARSAEDCDARLAELGAILADPDFDDARQEAAQLEYDAILNLGDLRARTADELANAERWLETLLKTGKTGRQLRDELRSSFLKNARAEVAQATGRPRANANQVSHQENAQRKLKAQASNWATQLLDVFQFLDRLFPGSRFVADLRSRLRVNLNGARDMIQARHKAWEAKAAEVLGERNPVKRQHRLWEMHQAGGPTGVHYYTHDRQAIHVPIEHAERIYNGDPMGDTYAPEVQHAIIRAYEDHLEEGETLKVLAGLHGNDQRVASIDFAQPVTFTGDLEAAGMRPMPAGRVDLSPQTSDMMAELSDNWKDSAGWQMDSSGTRPTLYRSNGQAFALFLTSKPGQPAQGQFFRVGLEQNLLDNPPSSPQLRGWAARRKITAHYRKPGQTEQNFSQWEAAYHWLLLRQPQYAEQADAMGFPPEAMTELERFLKPETKALALYMQEDLQNLYDLINPVYERLNGCSMARNVNYFPGMPENPNAAERTLDPLGPEHTAAAMQDGFTKRRVVHAAKPQRVSAFHVYFAHLQSTLHYVHFAEAARDMRQVFLDPAVQTSIKAAHGKTKFGQLVTWLKLIEGGGNIAAEIQLQEYRILNWMARNLATSSLAFKASTTLVQTSNVFASLAEIPAPAWIRAAGRLARNPARLGRTVRAMWKSPGIQRRLAEGFSPEMQLLMAPQNPRRASHWEQIGHAGLSLINKSDAGALSISLAVAYEHHYQAASRELQARAAAHVETELAKAINANGTLTEEQQRAARLDYLKAHLDFPHAEALRQVEEVLNRVQQPTTFMDKSLTEAARNPVMKLGLLMFMSDQRRKMSNLYTAAWRAATTKSKAARLTRNRLFILYFLILPGWEGAMRALAKLVFQNKDLDEAFDPKNLAAEILTGPTSGVPIAGPIYDTAIRKALGQRTFPKNPMIDTVAQLFDLPRDGKAIAEDLANGEGFKAIDTFARMVQRVGAAANGSLGAIGTLLMQANGVAGNVWEFLPGPAERNATLGSLEEIEKARETAKETEEKEKKAAGEAKEPAAKPTDPIDKALHKMHVGTGARAAGIAEVVNRYNDKPAELSAMFARWRDQKLISKELAKTLKKEYGIDPNAY